MKAKILTCFFAVALFAGCVHQPLVKHDQTLLYNRPFDYTYDEVIDAASSVHPWQLASTTRSMGEIVLLNEQYWDTLDTDKRTARILVKRVSRRQTSVQLAPESQNVIGVGEILKKIDQVLGQYKT